MYSTDCPLFVVVVVVVVVVVWYDGMAVDRVAMLALIWRTQLAILNCFYTSGTSTSPAGATTRCVDPLHSALGSSCGPVCCTLRMCFMHEAQFKRDSYVTVFAAVTYVAYCHIVVEGDFSL